MSSNPGSKIDVKFLIHIGLTLISAIVFILTMKFDIALLRNDVQYISKITEKIEQKYEDFEIRITTLEVKNAQER